MKLGQSDQRAGSAGVRLQGVRLGSAIRPVDVLLDGALIHSIEPSSHDGGGVLLPLVADVHVHLDKTYTIGRTGSAVGGLFDAIYLMDSDRANWSADDIRSRASTALERAYSHGVCAMRTHVDWTEPEEPVAWQVLRELAKDWRGRIHLQLASLSPLDLLAQSGETIARSVHRDGGVLGAFVFRNDNIGEKLGQLFQLANTLDLPLDFHVDEGLDDEARGFEAIIAASEHHARTQPILCGHVCALSLRKPEDVAAILARAAATGIGLVSLPTTNAYLQDRTIGRTPRMRGLAPVQEARNAGMDVMLASDNVRDAFYPYGDYDPLDILRGGQLAAQFEPQDWLDTITTTAARWCGTSTQMPKTGGPADFLQFEAADFGDLISRATARRHVWRAGRRVTQAQENHHE